MRGVEQYSRTFMSRSRLQSSRLEAAFSRRGDSTKNPRVYRRRRRRCRGGFLFTRDMPDSLMLVAREDARGALKYTVCEESLRRRLCSYHETRRISAIQRGRLERMNVFLCKKDTKIRGTD